MRAQNEEGTYGAFVEESERNPGAGEVEAVEDIEIGSKSGKERLQLATEGVSSAVKFWFGPLSITQLIIGCSVQENEI